MIKYHGTPFGGSNSEAAEALMGRHAFISFAAPYQLQVALDVCQSIALDNGAFSAWKSGNPIIDWQPFFKWAHDLSYHPRTDFIVIPDVIDGDLIEQTKLLGQFLQYFGSRGLDVGAPVFHLHEDLDHAKYLAHNWGRVCIGSSGEYSTIGTKDWYSRMDDVVDAMCDGAGRPLCKIHGLRMLDPKVFSQYPFASADSTNAARNCNIKTAWKGTYPPPSNSWRARVIMARTEAFNSRPVHDRHVPEWIKRKACTR